LVKNNGIGDDLNSNSNLNEGRTSKINRFQRIDSEEEKRSFKGQVENKEVMEEVKGAFE
jgi:hypothetical protein